MSRESVSFFITSLLFLIIGAASYGLYSAMQPQKITKTTKINITLLHKTTTKPTQQNRVDIPDKPIVKPTIEPTQHNKVTTSRKSTVTPTRPKKTDTIRAKKTLDDKIVKKRDKKKRSLKSKRKIKPKTKHSKSRKKRVHKRRAKRTKHNSTSHKKHRSSKRAIRSFGRMVRAKINANKGSRPRMAQRRGITGSARLTFTVTKSGRATNVRVSGESAFLQSARRALRRSVPFDTSRVRSMLPREYSVSIIYR